MIRTNNVDDVVVISSKVSEDSDEVVAPPPPSAPTASSSVLGKAGELVFADEFKLSSSNSFKMTEDYTIPVDGYILLHVDNRQAKWHSKDVTFQVFDGLSESFLFPKRKDSKKEYSTLGVLLKGRLQIYAESCKTPFHVSDDDESKFHVIVHAGSEHVYAIQVFKGQKIAIEATSSSSYDVDVSAYYQVDPFRVLQEADRIEKVSDEVCSLRGEVERLVKERDALNDVVVKLSERMQGLDDRNERYERMLVEANDKFDKVVKSLSAAPPKAVVAPPKAAVAPPTVVAVAPPTVPMMDGGIIAFGQNLCRSNVRTVVERVTFASPFKSPPSVVAFISEIDCATRRNVRISVKVKNVTNYSCDVECMTWCDSRSFKVGVTWIAAEKSPFVKLGYAYVGSYPKSPVTLSTPQSKVVRFDGDSFPSKKVPKIMVAFSHLDIDGKKRNIRVRGDVENASSQSFEIKLQSWADSHTWKVGFAYVAVDESLDGLAMGTGPRYSGWKTRTPLAAVAGGVKGEYAFAKPIQNPFVAIGMNVLDSHHGETLRVRCKVPNVEETKFNTVIESWNATKVWSVKTQWFGFPLSAPKRKMHFAYPWIKDSSPAAPVSIDGGNVEFGRHCERMINEEQVHRVVFKRGLFKSAPKVVAFLSEIDCATAGQNVRVRVDVRKVTESYCDIVCSSWGDSKTFKVGVQWIAAEDSPRIRLGYTAAGSYPHSPITLKTPRQGTVGFKKGSFSSGERPQVMLAFSCLDIDTSACNVRIKGDVTEITNQGFQYKCESWWKSRTWKAGFAYVAVDKSLGFVGNGAKFFGWSKRIPLSASPVKGTYGFGGKSIENPLVLAGMSYLDSYQGDPLRVRCSISNVSEKDFQMCIDSRTHPSDERAWRTWSCRTAYAVLPRGSK